MTVVALALKSRAPLMEIAHVAKRLGYAQQYVRQLIHDGKLRAVRFGNRFRVDEDDLDVFIEAHRTTPARRQTDALVPREKSGR